MNTPLSASWRRIDTYGRDTAHLMSRGPAWRLAGTAVFKSETGQSVTVAYEVDLDNQWRTERGRCSGYVDSQPFRHEFLRHRDGWTMDGVENGLSHIHDLDFGFTPATNMPQMKRLNLIVGRSGDLTVAWFDLGKPALEALPQHYKRLDASRYAYDSPRHGYAGTIELAETGFAKVYPGLWELEKPAPAAS
jgi:hypothetical protein